MTTQMLTAEFIHHFSICNRYGFARRTPWECDFKNLFYALKDVILKAYGRMDGYDLQGFYKYKHYWAQSYHYDMQWTYNEVTPPDMWKQHLYESWCKDADPNDMIETSDDDNDMRIIWSEDSMVRCVSEHAHLLERWVLPTEIGDRVYHRPVDEFYYRAYKTDRHPEIVKMSQNFFALAVSDRCVGILDTVGDEKTPEGVNTFRSLKWLVRWCRENDVIHSTRSRMTRVSSTNERQFNAVTESETSQKNGIY